MDLNELQAYLERELTYPVDAAGVRGEVGDATVSAPDAEDTETIGDLLAPLGDQTYESATELHEAVVSQLPDEDIGRKFYDDRGDNVSEGERVPEDEKDQSF